MSFCIKEVKTEYLKSPIGLDCAAPRFSWQMDSHVQDAVQTAYRVRVQAEGQQPCWDSDWVESSESHGVKYEGGALQPETRYHLCIAVRNESGEEETAEDFFETGLLDTSMDAWSGAKWIGSKQCGLTASAKSVFRIESTFSIAEGDCAGLVFGRNDPRLSNRYQNTFGIAGENYIAYVIDIKTMPAKLHIYRVGYAPGDLATVPFYTREICDLAGNGGALLTEANKRAAHTLRIDVLGNQAKAYLDGHLIDEEVENPPYAPGLTLHVGRQLNPLGRNDVITFPLMHEVGFYAKGSVAAFEHLTLTNVRTPQTELFQATAAQPGAFSNTGVEVTEAAFVLRSTMITVDPSHGGTPLLRKEISLKPGSSVQRARLYVTARGIYECEVNGERVGDDWFQPGASQYDKHLYYQTYDITEAVKGHKEGLAMGFALASGWWSDSQTFTVSNHNYYGDRPSLLAKAVVEYADGSKTIVVTEPESWQCSLEGPVRYASFFHGQHEDARRTAQYRDYACFGYNQGTWAGTAEVAAVPITEEKEGFHGWPNPNSTQPQMQGEMDLPVRAVETLTAVSKTEVRPGVFLYDMGQNMVGVPEIVFQGEAGETAVIRYSEVCYPALPAYEGLAGLPLMENLRDAACTDRYILRGAADGETFAPRFTFHGYRYVEITGVAQPPEPEAVRGVVLTSASVPTGRFSCDDPLVNRFYENVGWSQRGNFLSIPTDCPQRNERMGWMGDAQVFAQTALYQADVRTLYYRYLQAVRDVQASSGRYADIAPIGGGFGGIVWGSAGIIIPYETHKQLNDMELLRENYPAMKRYMAYLQDGYQDGLLREGIGNLGDWLAADMSTDNDLIWSAYFAYDAKLMAEMAKALGNTEDAAAYGALFAQARADWNNRFVTKDGVTLTAKGATNDTQCSYAVPLYFGVASEENRFKMAANLNRKTEQLGDTLTTGFVGTAPICQVLSAYGYHETACRLMRQREYPSWLYSVTQGATTIWERWNSFTMENGFGGNNNMNSFNHYSLGAVCAWLYRWVLGIQEDGAGYHRFVLRPGISGFGQAAGSFTSPYGTIKSAWERKGGRVHWQVTIPANTSAKLCLPVGREVLLNGNPLTDRWMQQDDVSQTDLCYTRLGGGTYELTWDI